MLNEAIDENDGKFITIEKDLSNNYNIKLYLTFRQTKRKRYLIKESIELVDNFIDNQVELEMLKSFCKRYLTNRLYPNLENKYLKLSQKKYKINNNSHIEKTLNVKGSKFYLNELDIEAILEIWKVALFGFSKVELKSNQVLVEADKYSVKFNGSKYITDPKSHMTSLINPNPKFSEVLEDNILNGKFDENKLKMNLKSINVKQ